MFCPYDMNNLLLKEQYQKDNYVIYHHINGVKGKCNVYFSGNGLYVADSEESFRIQILEKDRYEWKHYVAKARPEKEIFIRDIWLSWYAMGINSRLNSLEAVADWIKRESKGFQVTLIGNSAGGYMAVNCAEVLGGTMVERVFSLCGQFSLLHHNGHVYSNPLLAVKFNKEQFECYQHLDSSGIERVYYLYSGGVDHDCEQAEYAACAQCVKAFAFQSQRHGITAHNFDYPQLFSMNNEELDVLYEKYQLTGLMLTADTFSVMAFGKLSLSYHILKECMEEMFKKVWRRIGVYQ